VKAKLDEFDVAKNCTFNLATSARLTISMGKLHATIHDMTPKEADIIKSDASLPLSHNALGIRQNDSRVAAYRIIQAAGPEHMPSAPYDILAYGIAVENWNRALVLLKHYSRESGPERLKQRTNTRAVSAAKDAAVAPKFLRDDELGAMVAGETGSDLEDPFYTRRDRLEAALSREFEDDSAGSEDLDMEDVDALEAAEASLTAALTKLPTAANAAVDRKSRSQRQRMTVTEALRFTRSMLKRSR
jgi:hypothetical protein